MSKDQTRIIDSLAELYLYCINKNDLESPELKELLDEAEDILSDIYE